MIGRPFLKAAVYGIIKKEKTSINNRFVLLLTRRTNRHKFFMFLYRDILKRSLKITWDHKYLWFFGLFASLLAGTGRFNVSFSQAPEDWNRNLFSGLAVFFNDGVLKGNFFRGIREYYQQDPVAASIFIVFFLVVVVLGLFLLWLAVVSQAGLNSDAAKIIKSGDKGEKTTIGSGLEVGAKKFWPVLGFNLIAIFFVCLFSALAGLPLVFMPARPDFDLMLLYTLLFILFIPLALIISFLGKYAVCFSVIKGKKFVDSIIDAINLFGKNWLISIEMALILFFIDFIAVFIVGLALLVLAVPYFFAAMAIAMVFSPGIFWLSVVLALSLACLFVVLAGSILTTFHMVAWTDIFINLVDKKGSLAKIIRLAEGMKK